MNLGTWMAQAVKLYGVRAALEMYLIFMGGRRAAPLIQGKRDVTADVAMERNLAEALNAGRESIHENQ